MAELEEKLGQLLGDEAGLKKILDTASSLLANNGDEKGGAAGESTPEAEAASPALGDLLGSILGSGGSSGSPGGQSSLGSALALPQLLGTLTGKKSYIKEEKLNLVKAMRPYLAEERAGSVDRAIRLANLAKATKAALGLLRK